MCPPLSSLGGFQGSLHPAHLSLVVDGFHPFHWLHCALFGGVQFGHGHELAKHGHVTSGQPFRPCLDCHLCNLKKQKIKNQVYSKSIFLQETGSHLAWANWVEEPSDVHGHCPSCNGTHIFSLLLTILPPHA